MRELKEAMSASIFEAFLPLAQELRSRPDADDLIAFLLKYFFSHHRMERVQDREKAEHKREEHERTGAARSSAKKEKRRDGPERREGERGARPRSAPRAGTDAAGDARGEGRGDEPRAERGERAARPRREERSEARREPAEAVAGPSIEVSAQEAADA